MSASAPDKLIFTRHLAVLIKAGIGIAEGLETLAKLTPSSDFSRVLRSVHTAVLDGSTLEKALSAYPKVFDRFYLGIIRVGESSGTLDTSLEYLSEQLQREHQLRRKVAGAMMYPMLVLAATLILGAFVSLFILPKLVDFFSSFETALPLTTVILLKFALFMKNYGLLFFGILLAVIFFLSLLIRLPVFRPRWHQFLLSLPLFGSLLRQAELSRFSRSLGLLIRAGVPLSAALEITAQSLDNLVYRSRLAAAVSHISAGKNVAATLRRAGDFLFPALAVDILEVGEKSGHLDQSLLYISQFYDDEIDEVTKNLSNLLEPALLIFIGLVVGFMSLAIISPIYQLTGVIGQ